jgi:putative SOS response-associated peptidase YedK
MNRYVGNLPPMPGVFPDYPAPVVRNAGAERELTMMRWGMPAPPRTGGPPVTNIRNTSSPHWRGWLKPENRYLVPVNSFAEYAPESNPEACTFNKSFDIRKCLDWDTGVTHRDMQDIDGNWKQIANE